MDEEVWTKYRREDLYDEQGLQNGTGKIVVLTAPQPVLVIMSLRKGNVLAIKRRSSYLIQWTSKQRWYYSKSWLSYKIKKRV